MTPPTTQNALFPRLRKGALVSVAPDTQRVLGAIEFQFNPDTVSRRVDARAMGAEGGDRAEVFRLAGPPKETITLSGVEFDCSEQLGEGEERELRFGLHPLLAALELLLYPELADLRENARLADSGNIEIIPPEAPMTLFVWGDHRVLPVRLSGFSIAEEFYDTALNPVRAKLDITMQVLSTADFRRSHAGYSLFEAHHQSKLSLAGRYSESSASRGLALRQYLAGARSR